MKAQHKIILFLLFMLGLPTANAVVIVLDGGFEAGTPSPFWSEYSMNFGTPLCTVAICGTGGGTGPNTGDWWAWFGGISDLEVAHLSQLVTIPNGSADLNFWFENPSSSEPGGDFFSVLIDEVAIWQYETHGYLDGVPGYTEISINIDAFADGGSHTLTFYAETNPVALPLGITSFYVDDVSIVSTVPIPPAAWLFGTGLVGLVGVARRKATNH